MSNFKTRQMTEEESLSPSSDEKMDTGSESFRSQDTPNSNLSSDFDEKSDSDVLRLQNPEDAVLRLSEPNHTKNKLFDELSNSFVTKMSNLHLEPPLKPKNLDTKNKNPSLVLTTSHPLMITTPDDFPDLIPKKNFISKEDQELSLSSIEDEKPVENGYGMYNSNINNSKNNLYFSENFVTAESNYLSDSKVDSSQPDVAKVTQQRRKIVARFAESPPQHDTSMKLDNTPHKVLGRIVDSNRDDSAITNYIEARNKKLTCHSTPKTSFDDDKEVDTNVTEWCGSNQIRVVPNFELPIELSSNVANNHDLDSPDVLSTSTQDSRSAYEARLDPVTGNVSLRPTAPRAPAPTSPHTPRRKIIPPPDEDRCSLDSVSVDLDSEEEPPELPVDHQLERRASDEHKQSESSKTCSECSDTIPEYSAAEELHNERSFVSVRCGDTHTTLDMKVIEPFKRVISHGGYDTQGSAVIVFSACFLPDTRRPDYRYTMDQLFLYVIWTLERLIGEDYVLVYLHGSAGPRRLPSWRWLHECYRLIDRRLRKSLKHLYLVHPTFWLKSFVVLTKPFVSSKFFRKLSYVQSLEQLFSLVPVAPHAIPDPVKQYDSTR